MYCYLFIYVGKVCCLLVVMCLVLCELVYDGCLMVKNCVVDNSLKYV